MRVISILNLKGGVGKTLTAASMAYEMHRRGFKVLLIDNDKQGNLSRAYGRYDAEHIAPVTRLLTGSWTHPNEIIQRTDYDGIDIIASNMSLFGAAWDLAKDDGDAWMQRYRDLVRAGAGQGKELGDIYDYCITDNPPDIGFNVINALAITQDVIVPVKIDEDALEGLEIVAGQIEAAGAFNPHLKLRGILITDYQHTDAESAGLEWLGQQEYGKNGRILGVIRHSKKVAECSFLRKPVYEYSPCCAAAQDYKKFVTEYTGKGR